MTKYLMDEPFSTEINSEEYRQNFDRIFKAPA
jgi:hypothetical protein